MSCIRRLLPVLMLALPLQVLADQGSGQGQPWIGLGLGGGSVNSIAPAPSAGRDAFAASVELGYRFTPGFGLGLELGAVTPVSGCRDLQCGDTDAAFAPSFNRLFAFGEFRPGDSGLRLRAGFGVSRFCYQRHWDKDAWSMFDTVMLLIDDDYLDYSDGSGAYRCDASRKALGGAVSVGYDWSAAENAPVSVGVRLTAEAANFSRSAGVGLPSFRHRAVMLSLHVRVN